MKKQKKEVTDLKVNEPGKLKKFFSKVIDIIKKRWLIDGTKTIILVAIIAAIYVGINILLDKVTLPELDLTSNKLYSISDETKDKIGDIDQEVTITLINSDDIISEDFVEKYKAINKNISIEKIDDLSSRTDLMQKYSLEATTPLIIVSSGDLEQTLGSGDLSTFDWTTYSEIDTTEEALTNAIVNVTTASKPKIYFMTNHAAYSQTYFSSIISELEDESNEVDTIDILQNGSVPEDCDTLVITTLKEDITEQERDKILEYIRNGGNLMLMCGPNINGVNLTNFEQVLAEYGITISDGVIFEQESSNILAGYPDIIIEDVQSTSVTEKISNMTLQICLTDSGKITFDEDNLDDLGVTYETIATTSTKAFERTNINLTSATRTTSDGEEEQAIVAALVTKQYTEEIVKETAETTEEVTDESESTETEEETIDETAENEETEEVETETVVKATSKLIVYANELFAMDMQIQISGYQMTTGSLYNNQDMILNSISYLNNRENTITIRKDYDSVTYTVTEEQHDNIMAIIFITPLVIIALGIVVWIIRRRSR